MDIFGSNSAKPDSTNEKLVLNLDSKTDSSYVYYLKNKDNDKSNENIYSIECSQEGINGKILGNSVMLLPYKNDIRIGDTWDSTSNLSSASGMSSGPSSLKFDYKVTDVKTIRLLGEERNAITVKVNFRDLNILQYTVVQGVGISEFTIALDLDKFGGYSNQVTLQSAQ